jgi:3-deoxy-D-manno-octulosonic-acid transferase
MIWLYRLFYLPALLLALPYYGLRMWRRGGYAKDFQHRLGRYRRLPPPAPGKKRIWLQAVSVGEVFAISPLIDALQQEGRIEIVLTTTTSTGYAEARKRYADRTCSIGIFPLDFWLCSRTAWQRIQPDAIILTESELWPEHLHQARQRGVPTFLVNARISDTSFKRYQQVSKLAQRLLRKLDHLYAASDLDQSRLVQLGVDPQRIASSGSIKFDVAIGPRLDAEERAALRNELGFGSDTSTDTPFILLGSSTWPGEEAALLRIQQTVIQAGVDCRLLLVPRHAERGPELVRLLANQPLEWHQRSQATQAHHPVQIHLADTTGELTRLTQVADLAFIGKSLAPNCGGQTPIEAAGLGVPLLMGPNMNNFRVVAQSLRASGAARVVADAAQLEAQVLELVKDASARASMRQAGGNWHTQSKGSSARIAASILAALQ